MTSQSKKPIAHILTGVPYSGKTTFVNSANHGYPVLSSDKIVKELAENEGLNYNTGFEKYIKEATKLYNEQLTACIKDKSQFIIDRTNLTKKSRAKFMKRLTTDGFNTIGYYFEPTDLKTLKSRINKRKDQKVPLLIVEDMIKTYEKPTFDEGFDVIVTVKDGEITNIERKEEVKE